MSDVVQVSYANVNPIYAVGEYPQQLYDVYVKDDGTFGTQTLVTRQTLVIRPKGMRMFTKFEMDAARRFCLFGSDVKFVVTSAEIRTNSVVLLKAKSHPSQSGLVNLANMLCQHIQQASTCDLCKKFVYVNDGGFTCECDAGPGCSAPNLCCNSCACKCGQAGTIEVHSTGQVDMMQSGMASAFCCLGGECGDDYETPEWVLQEEKKREVSNEHAAKAETVNKRKRKAEKTQDQSKKCRPEVHIQTCDQCNYVIGTSPIACEEFECNKCEGCCKEHQHN